MVLVFSFLLILGMVCGQGFNLSALHGPLGFAASVCLAYIMMEVGVEFSIEQKSVKQYGWDFVIAASAAILPALLWFGYFILTGSEWKPAVLAGLSSAPTSAGILFAMMAAAGLSAGWVFKKARVLAVLDDLVTILLLTPLQVMMYGFSWKPLAALGITCILLGASFRFVNTIPLPSARRWLIVYAALIAALVFAVEQTLQMHVGVLVPAFVWGCVLRQAGDAEEPPAIGFLDAVIKGAFMLLVGLTFPKIAAGEISWTHTAAQVLILTFLANLGKFFLVFCYKTEATLKERVALGIAMFPRGEVGAAVLMIAISYGLSGPETTLAILSLALNLIFTGFFIWYVVFLLKD